MVIAGPGTGKTQIIALRTANILLKTDVNPENILITTFTEAGVISIKKRLMELVGTVWSRVNVSTIHAFCNDVIQAYPERFLAYKAGRSVDDIEQIEIWADFHHKFVWIPAFRFMIRFFISKLLEIE